MSNEVDLGGFPKVPKAQRPMSLYVAQGVDADLAKRLKRYGWKIVDVRTLPNKTDADRAEAVKARLEGIRQGSIIPATASIRHLELEARCYGLLDKNKQAAETSDLDEQTLDNLLDFSSKRAGGKVEVTGGNNDRLRKSEDEAHLQC